MTAWKPGIYAILDVDRLQPLLPEDSADEASMLLDYARAAVDAGATAVQLRAKSWPIQGLQLPKVYGMMVDALGDRVPVLLNDALSAVQPHGAKPGAGLHVGQDDFSPTTARFALGDAAIIGYSTHDLAQVEIARRMPVTYIGFGPVRATDSKQGAGPAVGFEALAAAVRTTAKPVVAIGGLGIDDIEAVRQTGAASMAVIGAWLGTADRPATVQRASMSMSMLVATWIASAPA